MDYNNSYSMIKESLYTLLRQQAEVRELHIKISSDLKKIKEFVQKICDDEFEEFKVKVFVSNMAGADAFVCPYYENTTCKAGESAEKTFAKINGKWSWYNQRLLSGDAYPHKVIKDGRADPFNVSALELKVAELTESLGVNINIAEFKFAENSNKPKNIDDIIMLLYGAEILAHGKIWSIGWDIPDHWAIAEAEDGIHVFYSTNGHGIGYDFHLTPGMDLDSFVELSKGDGFEGSPLPILEANGLI